MARQNGQMSAPARALLNSLRAAGADGLAHRQLADLQRDRQDGRSTCAIQRLPYNLQTLGYIARSSTRPENWAITAKGRAATSGAFEPKPSVRRAAEPASAVALVPALPVRRVAYGRGHVNLPVAPRSVFELGGMQ